MMNATGKLRYTVVVFVVVMAIADARLMAAEIINTSALVVTNLAPSPVQKFRTLLAMDSNARAEQLSNLYPAGMREPIEAKVNEYLALPADEREARLQATELRHYLTLLLPLTNRLSLVTQIAEPMRGVVEARLEKWEIMPPQMQEEFLENERVVSYFTQFGAMTPAQRNELLREMTRDQRVKLEDDIRRWRGLTETDRSRAFAEFHQIFSLTTEERKKALSYLSDVEREAMETTLETFEGLTPEQRKICIQSFQKFTRMNLAERQEFLKKADAWKRMTPAEREQWRELVRAVPDLPPFPAVATSVTPQTTKSNSVPVGKMTNGGKG